jgi:hypothetical protein
MSQHRFELQTLAVLVLCLLVSSSASAQATRTWVSGVGDDANPCSRTAPCKTFAGAISKTAAGGEIDVIDPGGFGAITITKSITIDGNGTFASVLGAGTNGITVNAGASDVVTIRNISINGAGTGINGIRFVAGGALHVENCVIFDFTQKGIDFEPSASSKLFVKDTILRNNFGGGALSKPGVAGSAVATLDNVRMDGNTFGVQAERGSAVTIRNSEVSGSSQNGIAAFGGSAVFIHVEDSVVTGNGAGIRSGGGSTTIRLSNVTAVSNGVGLLLFGGAVESYGNNRLVGNTTDTSPTSTIAQQ